MVKVADFGVARVKAQSGVMTAETGTYRWMAPEVSLLLCELFDFYNAHILSFFLCIDSLIPSFPYDIQEMVNLYLTFVLFFFVFFFSASHLK